MKFPRKLSALGDVMQLAFVPGNFDATLKFWSETMGVGPFYVLCRNKTEWARYRGVETLPELSVAFGHWNDMQIEIIQQHNDVPSPYRDWRLSGGRSTSCLHNFGRHRCRAPCL